MKHVPITQKAKTKFTFKDNMDISMNADGSGGAFKSPNKNLEKVAEQLEGAVKAHGQQAKAVRKHIAEMKSPAKERVFKYSKKDAEIELDGAKLGRTPTARDSAYAARVIAPKRKAGKNVQANYDFMEKNYPGTKERKNVKYQAVESPAKRKDACYTKVKSRYTKWPSAYASGALAKCRKVGAANWGNKSK